ncbi:MAG: hypothetical protein M1275_02210, partial [Patescibacteria group bacterium]|nr:hypothetical protein [Patescibacteria group bacterium]
SGAATFSNPANLMEEMNIAVSDAKNFSTVATVFKGYDNSPVTVDGVLGTEYSSSADSLQAVLLVKNGRLYYFSGQSERFSELVSGFKFLK